MENKFEFEIGEKVKMNIGSVTLTGIVRGIFIDEHSIVNYYLRSVSDNGQVTDSYYKQEDIKKS